MELAAELATAFGSAADVGIFYLCVLGACIGLVLVLIQSLSDE